MTLTEIYWGLLKPTGSYRDLPGRTGLLVSTVALLLLGPPGIYWHLLVYWSLTKAILGPDGSYSLVSNGLCWVLLDPTDDTRWSLTGLQWFL